VDVFFKDQRPTAVPDDASSLAPADANGPVARHEDAPAPSSNGAPGSEDAPAAGSGQAPHDWYATTSAAHHPGGEPVGAEAPPEQAADASSTDGLRPVPGASYGEIPLEEIRPNPRQPRSVFDEDDMAELVHSIREIGVLQPIVVRPVDVNGDGIRYELIMGERRWRASREAGQESIPAIVKSTDDDDLLRDALLENLHRSELNALEEAAAYQQLLEDFGCTHDELAGRIGRSRPQISNTLRLLKLPPLVARRVAAGVLSAGHARALLALEDGGAMERLAQRIVAEGLSVRSVEEIVAMGADEGESAKRRRPRAGNRHPQLDDLAARLSDRFDTRVNIALGQRKGKLTVEFASVDDLHRIVDLLGIDPRG
jgi:ParB family chromosome partitioning protein